MNAVAINITPDLIAAEINHIKDQTRRMALYNAIEIGRRLAEAKTLVPHGSWGKWLEESVDYSQSTANNLMRIFEEYGAEQLTLFGNTGAKSQALGSLSYTQAVALLCLPEKEREQFVEEHDMDSMSTRELQKALKERDQARQELNDAKRIVDEKSGEAKKLQDEIEAMREELEKAKAAGNEDEIQSLKMDLEEADAQLLSANEEIAELNRQLKEQPIDVQATTTVEKMPEEIEKELAELRKLKESKSKQQSTAIPKFAVYFDELVKGFSSLLGALAQIEEEADQETYEKYKHATLELISKMSARV